MKKDPKELFIFAWEVPHCGYQWIEATPVGLFGSVRGPKGLFLSTVHSTDEWNAPPYYPLTEHSGLFLEFARLDPERPDCLLQFANQYGLLGEGVNVRLPSSKQNYNGESYDTWFNEIQALHDAVELWTMLRNQDRKGLKKIIQWTHKDRVIYRTEKGMRAIASSDYLPEWLKRFPPNDVILPAWRTLQIVISEHLSGRVSPEVFWQLYKQSSGNPLELYFLPHTLIGALWLQCAQAVTGGRDYRQCQHCGKPFILAPDTARTNRLNCSDSCKTLAWRKRTKGKTTKAP